MLQVLKPTTLEAVLCSERSHRKEKPAHRSQRVEQPKLSATREKPVQQQRSSTAKTNK